MISMFKPSWMFRDIYHVSPEFLAGNHIKYVLTDLDNTLIPWNQIAGDEKLAEWLKEMKKYGIKVIVVSNNSYSRIEHALVDYDVNFVSRALKPLTFGIDRAIRKYSLNRKETVMIGDQLMTDVFSANNSRINSILVKPLVNNDSWTTWFNRFIERFVFQLLKKKYSDIHWQ
ncbi:YqeG family HAD IIIA-type phosphatase [Lentilactobacillus sp. SPB1-3]|uniref:YqeG family HAD IIIA-type phosphatase n=1 Tax=Lentilactobacillus terminaliae TaxID=3003483 RepID=A0ACD5DI57_9LACO|nr:YqeG family HAD IIIA-type phosphatase [Lentilactobacillus sp. SPB1-3]MCZ0977088.1 YqeG family HAD IIIA-type phosphatase [Lentilactobacillus sp. SPB1-3]